jgi:hypothetical protein
MRCAGSVNERRARTSQALDLIAHAQHAPSCPPRRSECLERHGRGSRQVGPSRHPSQGAFRLLQTVADGVDRLVEVGMRDVALHSTRPADVWTCGCCENGGLVGKLCCEVLEHGREQPPPLPTCPSGDCRADLGRGVSASDLTVEVARCGAIREWQVVVAPSRPPRAPTRRSLHADLPPPSPRATVNGGLRRALHLLARMRQTSARDLTRLRSDTRRQRDVAGSAAAQSGNEHLEHPAATLLLFRSGAVAAAAVSARPAPPADDPILSSGVGVRSTG